MSDKETARQRSEMLKRLRTEHAEFVERTQALLKEQKQIQKIICQSIHTQARTVPEIAEQIGMPTHEVLWYLTAFKKYNLVVEDGMDGDYVLYREAQEK